MEGRYLVKIAFVIPFVFVYSTPGVQFMISMII